MLDFSEPEGMPDGRPRGGGFVLDVYTSFARTFGPTPDEELLGAKRYESTGLALEQTGKWEAAVKGDLKFRALEPAGDMKLFGDVEQCEWLDRGMDYQP
ncbi:hypothetical protein VUR80DRAFT_6142 [Thermomyces stellatus]